MAENGPIEEVAKIVSNKLFRIFKWQQHGPFDQDFPCRKEKAHKPAGKNQRHQHPVDVVFSYKDPYSNKVVYLNTDLKSYSKNSIKASGVEAGLISLAKTIDCAQNSEAWKTKYEVYERNFEVRGLLFVYNHDNKSEKDFYEFFNPVIPSNKKRKPASIKMENIPIPKNKQIHIIEPKQINYMMAISADINEMIAEETFPKRDYGFYYPQLTFHKVLISDKHPPATIELLSSPFMIIKHDGVNVLGDNGKAKRVHDNGYVVYYNRDGSTDLEFLYLLDTLSKYQILDGDNNIRIRVAHPERSSSIQSNFSRAIKKYAHDWGFDEESESHLNNIELFSIPMVKEFYSTEEISWERVRKNV